MRGAAAAAAAAVGARALPEIKLRTALTLEGEPANDEFATKNQAMGTWAQTGGKEHIVALVHRFGDIDRRADDRQFAVAWESDGETVKEVKRVEMSCPDVELVVPSRGPFVYEARLDTSPYSLHPECSCPTDLPCPAGVRVTANAATRFLMSPVLTHLVHLQNEFEEYIADPATLGRLRSDVEAPAASPVGQETACPGTRDEPLGSDEVTFAMLAGKGNLTGVAGKWCLVRRGGCAETAKVKWCEASGAIGTIIADHGSFDQAGDQEVIIRYYREQGEKATRPVLFVSKADGDALFSSLAASGSVSVAAGPNIGGVPGTGFNAGGGVTVHAMSAQASGPAKKSYPDLFRTAGWLEVSDLREILFVCMPSLAQVRLYDVSAPMTSIPLLSTIANRPCSKDSMHDYRVLDYRDAEGRFTTLLVDPADRGNRLYYYDTEDPKQPRLLFELHANWEANNNGLGQLRPGGPGGRFHFVTWHCSSIYCDKNHGDSLYVLDSFALEKQPKMVKLPMSLGSFARDVSCGRGPMAVCMVSLAWDGLVAVEPNPNVNQFRAIASYVGSEFQDDGIPLGRIYLKMYSGAQKIYSSTLDPRAFYVEHANFSNRQLRLGDTLRAMRSRELFVAKVTNYDEEVEVPGSAPPLTFGGGDFDGRGGRRERDGSRRQQRILVPVLAAFGGALLIGACFTACIFHKRRRARSLAQRQPPGSAVDDANVVVGRPVESDGDAAQGHPMSAAAAADTCESPTADKQPV